MRLFTALDPPSAVRDRCTALQEELSLDARWTAPEQFHVTLRFIGDTSADRAEQYEVALAALRADPVRCVPYGMDALPSRQAPRVLIVGLKRTESLMTLYERVSDALEAEGLNPEDRTYRPHLTLARLDDVEPGTVHAALQAPDDEALPDSFWVETFHLYESTLTPDGAVHELRSSFDLET